MSWAVESRTGLSPLAVCVLFISCAANASAQHLRDFHVPQPARPGSVLVIGFLGGFEHWDDPHRGIRKVVLDLRSRHLRNVYAETIENRHRELAVKLTAGAIGGSAARSRVRIILYGQSWGGAAVISTARDLQKLGVQVQLTVQVDSVGFRDAVVPANVLNAANLFQHDPFSIEGRTEIRAKNPARTRILENTQFSYLFRPYRTLNISDASWARRTFGGSHAKMELDGAVWQHVELLILDAIGNHL